MNSSKAFGLCFTIVMASLLFTGTTTAFAGLDGLPDFEDKTVKDTGNEVSFHIDFLGPVPTSPPGFFGTATIIGEQNGMPVIKAATSHAFVCDSESQFPFDDGCEGVWHNHHGIITDPVDLPSFFDIDGDGQPDEIFDCADQGAAAEIKALSFEDPGSIQITDNQIWSENSPKAVSGLNVIPPGFIDDFDFSPENLAPQGSYPVVKFNLFVLAADLTSDAVAGPVPLLDTGDNNGVPLDIGTTPDNTGKHVCVLDAMFMDGLNPVGGDSVLIDNTALLLAGLQSSLIWIVPAIAGIAGVGAYLIRTRMD